MTVLVSGFEPFGGDETNPSWETADALARGGHELVGDDVVAVRLPVTFDGAWPVLEAAIRAHEPSVIVALGLAGGSRAVRLERVAIDVVDARIPDNAGAATGIVGAAGGMGGFFPPLVMGVVNDAFGSYSVGFIGLLVFTAGCLALTVWLLRSAPAAELRGRSA